MPIVSRSKMAFQLHLHRPPMAIGEDNATAMLDPNPVSHKHGYDVIS
jgi:hypothetical protein